MSKSHNPFNNVGLLARALTVSCAFLLSVAATPRLGNNVPELPMADGSGDTPEILIDLLPDGAKEQQVKLSSFRGKVLLIDVFLSTCPHCQDHAPHIVELYNDYRDRGLTVLGLATDGGGKDNKDSLANIGAYKTLSKIEYQVGFLTPEVVAYYLDEHDHGVPQMVLFGIDGKMLMRKVGWNDKVNKEMRAAIDAQISKTPVVKPGNKASNEQALKEARQG